MLGRAVRAARLGKSTSVTVQGLGLFDPAGTQYLSKSVNDLHRRSGFSVISTISAQRRHRLVETWQRPLAVGRKMSVKRATRGECSRHKGSEPFTPP